MSNTRFSFEKLSLDCDDLDAVHEFLVASDFVKATDELEFLDPAELAGVALQADPAIAQDALARATAQFRLC